ncbi:MAG TPA: Crp/Fnr family transcriptional regulator [Chryseosolibacter sp.]|nr:Crp/Fnr family transcriptional regulator [Chryseosolibacter sp.]
MGLHQQCPQVCADHLDICTLSALRKSIGPHIKTLRLQPRAKLLQPGNVPSYLYFLNEGNVCSFKQKKARKYITSVWQSCDIILPGTFLDQRPSAETIELLTRCKVSALSYDSIRKIIAGNIEAAGMFQILFNKLLNDSLSMIEDLKQKTALQRYSDFTAKYKGIEHLLPQNQIASLLGIKPQSLSRIRKVLLMKEKLQIV